MTFEWNRVRGAGRTAMVACVLCVAASVALPARAAAQSRMEWTLEVRPFGGSLSLARRITDGILIGAAVGGGIDVLDRTIAPDPAQELYHGFDQLGHVNLFLRQKPTDRFDLDLGLRVGVGGVRECFASDCWPGAFAGLYAAAFWGSQHVKIGPRVMWALARDDGMSDPVLYTELLTIRFSF